MWKTFLRPRTLAYLALWAGIGIAMLVVLAGRERLDISVAQDRNPIMVRMADGELRNGYTVRIMNREARAREVALAIEGLPGARMWESIGEAPAAPTLRAAIRPDGLETLRVFVRVPPAAVPDEHTPFRFVATSIESDAAAVETVAADTRFTVTAR
jgi:polyferredoxin